MQYEYVEPKSIESAIALLAEKKGAARVMAGGTDLFIQLNKKIKKADYVIDICRIPGLDQIEYDEKTGIKIGAMATIRSIELSPVILQKCPVLSHAAGKIGSVAIRNVGTIGGNLCNASPSAETAPALIGLSATVKINGPGTERMLFIEDFFKGPGKSALSSDEMLTEIQVPVPPPSSKGVYLKHAIRGSIELAIVGAAVVIDFDDEICRDVKIVLGAVAPTPLRATQAEKIIKGKKLDDALIEKCAQAASDESKPITDVRASAEYRKEMVEVLVRKAVKIVGNISSAP